MPCLGDRNLTASLTCDGCYDRLAQRLDADLPGVVDWDLSFTGHAELRMEQRVTEVEVRAMLSEPRGSRPVL